MEKEILTKEIIRSELIERNKQSVGILILIVIAIYCILTLAALSLYLPLELFGKASLFNIAIAVIITFFIQKYYTKILRKVKAGEFKITEDKLTGFEERIGNSRSRHGRYRPFTLHFASYGEFKIHDTETLYKWSKKVNMGDNGFQYTSNAGDEFYIITLDYKKILYLYPKKFFELK